MFVTIGRIGSSFGLRGELKVSPESDHPERVSTLPGMTVFVLKDSLREPYRVAEVGEQSTYWRLKLVGIDSRAQAERLVGGELQIPRTKVLPLPADSFYIFDLIGLNVYTQAGELLGEVVEVLQPGANDVYVVRNQSDRELLIPALKQVVKQIDVAGRRMVVEPLPGLFDPEEVDSDAD